MLLLWVVIIFIAVAIDRVTKYLIIQNVEYSSSLTIIDRFFYITNIRNKGAAWSLFQNGRYFFIITTIIVCIAIVYFFRRYDNKILRLALALILGGALGNFIDRVFYGSVVDFLHFYIGTYSFPVFNAADVFVCTGTFVLAIYLLFIHKENPKPEKDRENIEKVR